MIQTIRNSGVRAGIELALGMITQTVEREDLKHNRKFKYSLFYNWIFSFRRSRSSSI